MKDSPKAPMTFSIEVEPSVATVPLSSLVAGAASCLVSAAEVSAAVSFEVVFAAQPANRASAHVSASSSAMIFFIFCFSFDFNVLDFLSTVMRILPARKMQKRRFVKSA